MKGRPNPHNPRFVLRVAPAPRAGNVLSEWLSAQRDWLDDAEVMTWLYREHPKLMRGAVIAQDLDAGRAAEALALVKQRLGQRRRWRG